MHDDGRQPRWHRLDGRSTQIPFTRSHRIDGRELGMAVSHFIVDNDPGEGPDTHRHHYDEIWSLITGEATFTVADRSVVATAGDTVAVPARTWHRFCNTGQGRLVMVCIHDSEVIEQEWAQSPTTTTTTTTPTGQ